MYAIQIFLVLAGLAIAIGGVWTNLTRQPPQTATGQAAGSDDHPDRYLVTILFICFGSIVVVLGMVGLISYG
jgi:hypothetical protein